MSTYRRWIAVTTPVRPARIVQYRRTMPYPTACACRAHRLGFDHIDLEVM